MQDSETPSRTPLDRVIRHCAIFVALRVYYAAVCSLTRLRPGKDGSRPYNTPSGRFLRLPASERRAFIPHGPYER